MSILAQWLSCVRIFTPSPFSLTQDPNSVQWFLFEILFQSGRESRVWRGPFCKINCLFPLFWVVGESGVFSTFSWFVLKRGGTWLF